MNRIPTWLKALALLLIAFTCYAMSVEAGVFALLIIGLIAELSSWLLLGNENRRAMRIKKAKTFLNNNQLNKHHQFD